MSLPILEQISTDIENSLAQITRENGYDYTLKVERFKRLGNPIAHLQAVVREENPTMLENTAQQFTEWQQPYTVVAYAVLSEDSAMPIMRLLNKIIADIHKIILSDPHRSNLAINTTIQDPEYGDMSDGISAVLVNFTVHYRHRFDDPYSQS